MDVWTDLIYPALIERAAEDAEYQEHLKNCEMREKEYETLRSELSDEQKAIIDRYISACEDMDYRLMQLAFWHGAANNV